MEVKDGNVYDGLRETVLKDRSRDVRRKVADYLEYKGKLNYKTATSLAKDKDPELRKLAAKHTVASLYWEETDYDVIRYMVENKLADRLCFELRFDGGKAGCCFGVPLLFFGVLRFHSSVL